MVIPEEREGRHDTDPNLVRDMRSPSEEVNTRKGGIVKQPEQQKVVYKYFQILQSAFVLV